MASEDTASAHYHNFWDKESVPKKDDKIFQEWISDVKRPTVPLFKPEDQHCGVWQSPPNKACHASFGDQGTTASVNCFGDMIQMTQYLGVGHSGLFSMEQRYTDEPFYVYGRAHDLERLAKSRADSLWLGAFDLTLPVELAPQEPLNVKWVNWRWPRYEYDTGATSYKSSTQWIVHDRIVLKQLILENATNEDLEVQFSFTSDGLIRDLDYLDGSYRFNDDDDKGYSYISGPNGFGHICVHRLDLHNEADDSVKNQMSRDTPASSLSSAPGDISRGPSRDIDCTTAARHNGPPPDSSTPPLAHSQSAQHETQTIEQTVGPLMDAQSNLPVPTEQAEGKAEDSQETATHTNDSHAVACVRTLFVNGKAIMTRGSSGSHTFTLAGKGPESTDLYGAPSELVVAYKMILLPKGPIHWNNFLVSAHEADVNTILRDEMRRLWGASETASLFSLGFSLGDDTPDLQAERSKVSKTWGTKNSPNNQKAQEQRENEANIDFEASNEHATTMMGYGNPRPAQEVEISSLAKRETTKSPVGTPNKTSPKDHVEYLLWRHLEHILSVCAVPLSAPALFKEAGKSSSDPPGSPRLVAKGMPVALTCGDMAGHRICTSASFFAFKFLIDVARRLNPHSEKSPFIQSLQQRIRDVCKGHIEWLKRLRSWDPVEPLEFQNRLLRSGCFAANYWATGFIMPSESSTWQSENSVTDTPFHILKIADYIQICDNEDELKQIRALLLDIWIPWLLELDRTDRRSSYSWPHTFHEGVHTFRLDDHVWVWRALKSLETLDLWKNLPFHKSIVEGERTNDDPYHWIFLPYELDEPWVGAKEKFARFEKVAKRLLPAEVQRHALMRFTTENDLDASRKRMLAMTRSPRETRFLFHSRDTGLFYDNDLEFFLPDSPYHELWKNTLEAQLHHDENKETSWDNAIRYALGIVVGTRDLSLNNKSPNELVRTCIDTLIRASSHAGFLPGQLDEATKEPRLFYGEEDANFYYHAGFEISHILLTHASRIEQAFHEVVESMNVPPSSKQSAEILSKERDSTIQSALAEILTGLTIQPKRQRLNEQGQQNPGLPLTQLGLTTGLDARRSLTMKKLIPFNSLIDVGSINVLEDEWLYNYPQFFTMEKVDLGKILSMYQLEHSIIDAVGEVIGPELERRITVWNQKGDQCQDALEPHDISAWIAETPKQKQLGKRERRQDEAGNTEFLMDERLWYKLRNVRTATKAKKRFIWLPHANAETAFFCWVASPEAEKPAMSLFFDRHSRYEKHVWDDTTMVINTWQTEFHLSFYTLVDADSPVRGLQSCSRDSFPGSSKKELRRASMGFRFDGDFFDRYWTCHYIEDIFTKHMDGTPFFSKSRARHEQKQWGQRKVLELHLLHRILKFATKSSLDILQEVRKELGIGDSMLALSILDSDAYFSTKENWQRFEHILQAVDEDLTTVLRTLEKWDRREAERGQEKPRWTRNDERKYRGVISKLQGSTEREMRDLESHRNNIRKLKETLTTRRIRIRDERELHQNENIRYFTYVTVIFLPLGFAASFFSMGGAPQYSLMISLVKFAVAAFGVTVGLLANAKTIFAAMDVILLPFKSLRNRAKSKVEQFSRDKREKSLLHMNREEHRHNVLDSVEQEQIPNRSKPGTDTDESSLGSNTEDRRKEPRTRRSVEDNSITSTWIWFWMTYIFFEVPGLRILTSVDILNDKTLSLSAVTSVILGVLVLPGFGVAWVVKFVFLNVADFVKVLYRLGRSILSAVVSFTSVPHDNTDEDLRTRFNRLTAAPDWLRPFKERNKADS